MQIGILGGGLSGITLQRFLRHPSEVLEAAPRPGGLCRTFWKDGFGYNVGGHILFSKDESLNALVDGILGENLNRCRRANQVLFKGRYVKYPFENDLAALDQDDCYACLIGFLKAEYPKPTNFEEWMYYTFGKGIAEEYLIPYNRKIWKTEPSRMGVEWVERVPRPPMENVVKSALGIPTEGYARQLFFRYPLRGGIESLVQATIGPQAKVICDAPVRRSAATDAAGRSLTAARRGTTSTSCWPSRSTRPSAAFSDVPSDVRDAVARLRYNAIRVALVAVNNESLMDRSAIYIPDPGVLPHRVCYMGFFSPHMVRPGTSSLVAEVTSRPGDEMDVADDDVFLERIVDDLDRVGVLRKGKVIVTNVRRFEYAYPVYDLDYTRNVAVVRDWFASLGIDLLGRFAQFEYINMDECLRRALALAERLNAREHMGNP